MDTVQTAFRLPVELIERLDTYAQMLSRDGLSVSRADAVRVLLVLGLKQAGVASKKRRTKKRKARK